MKKKQERTKTEEANIALNKAFNREEKHEQDIAPLINNNHTALVLSNIKNEENEEKTKE